MLPGDRIVSVAGVRVSSSDDIRAQSKQHAGQPTEYVVERDGQTKTLTTAADV